MSTAEELLRQAAENGAAATDIKPYLTVDLYGRQISIPNSIKNIGVESDDEVTRLYFKVPRYFDEVDLSEFRARINYTNANGEEDCYSPEDVEVTEEYITFSWLVGRFACVSAGSVEFNVCMIDYYDDGVTIDREFNTTPSTLSVLKGKETVPAIVEKERDAMAAVAKQAAEEALEGIDTGALEDIAREAVKEAIKDIDIDIDIPTTGTPGQAISFDSDGNLAPMQLFEDVTETEMVPGNLFDASVGYTEGYESPHGPIDLNTLKVPLDNPTSGTSSSYKLHNELIYLEPNTTYAISLFTGNSTLFIANTGARSGYLTPGGSALIKGDNCYVYTTGGNSAGYYLAIHFHISSQTAYEDMVIVKGDSIPTEKTTTVIGTRLNENITMKAEQVEGLEEMIPESSDATAASSDFDTLYAVARKVHNYQSPTTLTCSLMSDTHYQDSKNKADKALQTARTMGLMESYMKQDFIGNLGDMIPGDVDVETSRKYLVKLAQATNQNAKCPVFYARGNHDDNGWYSGGGKGGTYKTNEMLNDAEWYQAVFGISAKDLVIDSARPNGGYGYFDHEASKIRVFILNTEDLPYIAETDGTYRYSSYNGHAFSNEQLNFVANALYFEDKDAPKEWGALFMSHVPIDTTNDDGYRFGIKDALIRGHEYLLAIIAAYRKGSAFKASGSTYNASLGDISDDFNVSVDVDYTTKGGGDVIAFVSGHTHTDNFSSLVGWEESLSRGYAYIGLMGSKSFANFIFDRANNRICAVKYGTSSPDLTEGAAVEAPDTGSIESGEWTVNIEQFRPDGANLYNGLSEIHTGAGGIASATKIDKSTLEVDAIGNRSGYLISKAILLKPFTRYAIPSSWNGQLLAFGPSGSKSGYITPTAANGYKYFQTGIRQYYVVFDHHTGSYTDYANFWIKEMGEGVEYV